MQIQLSRFNYLHLTKSSEFDILFYFKLIYDIKLCSLQKAVGIFSDLYSTLNVQKIILQYISNFNLIDTISNIQKQITYFLILF